MTTPDDFPNATEIRDVSNETLLQYVRGGGLTDEAVKDELHRRHPELRWIDFLRDASYRADTKAAGGHRNVMRLQLAPKSATTLDLDAAYDAALAAVLGDAAPLAARPKISLAEWSTLAGVAERTLTSYAARDQAPPRCGFDPQTGRPVWDAAVARAWVNHRVGQGARTDLKESVMTTTSTDVTINEQTYRAILSDGQATIVTGPTVIDRIAAVVTDWHSRVAEMHPDVDALTVAQVMSGVMCELAAKQALDGISITDQHAVDTDYDGDLGPLVTYVEQVMSEGWIIDRMRSTYTRRGSTR